MRRHIVSAASAVLAILAVPPVSMAGSLTIPALSGKAADGVAPNPFDGIGDYGFPVSDQTIDINLNSVEDYPGERLTEQRAIYDFDEQGLTAICIMSATVRLGLAGYQNHLNEKSLVFYYPGDGNIDPSDFQEPASFLTEVTVSAPNIDLDVTDVVRSYAEARQHLGIRLQLTEQNQGLSLVPTGLPFPPGCETVIEVVHEEFGLKLDVSGASSVCEGTRASFEAELPWKCNCTGCLFEWSVDGVVEVPFATASSFNSPPLSQDAVITARVECGSEPLCTGTRDFAVTVVPDPVPPDQGNVLRCVKAGTTVELSYPGAPAQAYRIYRDLKKQDLGETVLLDETDQESCSDAGAVADARPFFYRVRGLSPCSRTPGP